jgi:hypothetical protein
MFHVDSNSARVPRRAKRSPSCSTPTYQTARLAAALLSFQNLLELYDPGWYTFQHHQHANSALRHSDYKPLVDAFLELHDLLEIHAPLWYTERDHNSAESALHFLKH